jgi:hypothetical protein
VPLHCDEPNGDALAPSEITPSRFGSVPRHYIRTTQDCAVPLAGQDYMISAVDDTTGGATVTHFVESSHSPFLSQPTALSKTLSTSSKGRHPVLRFGPRSGHCRPGPECRLSGRKPISLHDP